MPELPEVETTRRGIEPLVLGKIITDLVIRERRLRWPITKSLRGKVIGQRITQVGRRGKYLLIYLQNGTLILHLGMSGNLRLVAAGCIVGKHEHFDLVLADGQALRFTDPRRFGSIHWCGGDPARHKLLRSLGPEPLEDSFTAAGLFERSRGRSASVKAFIMDSRTVTGIGNIYANEALFMAGIHPGRQAGRISLLRYQRLCDAIRTVLRFSIELGGTTLRDFVNSEGKPGYFQQTLRVYGRGGEACRNCGSPIREQRLGQRSTFYCPACQR